MAPSVGSPAARTEFFKQLKPICVPLSQLAIRSTDKAAHAKELQALLERLVELWEAQASKDPSVQDDKLADYVFFPVSHILRSQDQYPMRLIETTIKLLRTLIQTGWKAKISKELTQQLFILLTFIIGDVPDQDKKKKKRDVPEETLIEALRTLGALVATSGSSVLASKSLYEEQMIPTLGHGVSVILDGFVAGATSEVQLAALDCLDTIYRSIKNHAALATFLPGTISSLSRRLSPPLSVKSQKRVLVRGLTVLQSILANVLGDVYLRNILNDTSVGGAEETTDSDSGNVLTPAWLKATASQVKIALSSVLKLRTNGSDEVEEAVGKLSAGLLDECHASLANCKEILVESAMITERERPETSLQSTSLQALAIVYPELGDQIRDILYKWLISLPRQLQSADERVKQQAVRNLVKANKLAEGLQLVSSTLEESLAEALRSSVVTLMLGSGPRKILDDVDDGQYSWTNEAMSKTISGTPEYRPVILAADGQRTTRQDFCTLVQNIGSSTSRNQLASDMLSYLRDSSGEEQVASFWLSLELVRASSQQPSIVDDLIDLTSLADSHVQDAILQELYEFSAFIVSSHSDAEDTDWRLQAIALEVTAFAAERMKASFRPELIDVLYPITTFMGSQNSHLQRHAVTTLNIIATACGYSDVSDLIIDNADYMVNSVSLRMNTFDITPASTRVLAMMVMLTGPKLIPYLDDVVASIFAALDNYHGYPLFVGGLFDVLSRIVQQGVKSDKLLLEEQGPNCTDHKKKQVQSDGVEGVLSFLEKRAKRQRTAESEDLDEDHAGGHPKTPWGPPKAKHQSFDETLAKVDGEDEGNAGDVPPSDVDKPKPPASPTYAILTRITTLTQHYLTSPAPSLRKSLLDLLGTVAPALAPDEDAFLPIVAAIWPVAAARLRDPESFVVIAACSALSALCASAGDFLASRIKTEWADGLGRWCKRARDDAAAADTSRKVVSRSGKGQRMNSSVPRIRHRLTASAAPDIVLPLRSGVASSADNLQLVTSESSAVSPASPPTGGLGRFAQASQVWAAVIGLLTAIVSYVRLDDDIFDQILDLLGDVVERDEAVRLALEAVNADAVWLALYDRGRVDWMATPVLAGAQFVHMAKV